MSLDPGRRIGAYEVVGPLGAGGMGEVYRARDTRLGRPVAIKLVSAAQAADATSTERLAREARLTSSLNHPNIVTVHDVGEVDGRPFIVMELIEGQSLHARLTSGRLTVRDAVDLAAQVADGLAAAHEAGVIHRDLKPRNVMITADGRAKIVDFGLGRAAPSAAGGDDPTTVHAGLTDAHAIVGTAGYMAPEQVTGRSIDARTDQFALGAMLYEMLTGRRAFQGDSPVQTMAAVVDAEPPAVLDVAPAVPPVLATVVERCLSKKPSSRYASTRDLARDLRDMGHALMAGSRSSASLGVRPRRRAAWPVRAVAALVLVLAGVYVVPEIWPGAEGGDDPVDEAHALLARYDKSENVDRAVELLRAAVAERPTDAGLQASLAEAYWRQYEHTRDTALIDRASGAAAEAIRLDETRADAHVALAIINNGQGRYHGAAGEAERAIALAPNQAGAWRELGRAQAGLGRRNDAEVTLKRAVAADPLDWTTHSALGVFYWSGNQFEEARAAFQGIIDVTPDNTRGYNNVGAAYNALQQFDEAAAYFERSATLSPNATAFSNLGTVLYNAGRYAESAEAHRRAVALSEAGFRYWRNLAAACYWTPGLRDEALSAYEKAAALGEQEFSVDSKNQNVLGELAATYAVLGQRDRARQLIGLLDNLQPTNADILATLGETWELLGERTKAIDRMAEAVVAGYPRHRVERSPWLAELRKDDTYRTKIR